MAKQRTQWGGILEGEIVNFRYKGKKKDAKSRNRTCLILNMRHMYLRNDGKKIRLIHALQLDAIPRPRGNRKIRPEEAKKIFKQLGPAILMTSEDDSSYQEQRNLGLKRTGTEKYAIGDQAYRINLSRGNAKKSYSKLKVVLEKNSIYRTFSWDILKRSSVFRDRDYDWPSEYISKFVTQEAKDATTPQVEKQIKESNEAFLKQQNEKMKKQLKAQLAKDLYKPKNITLDDI